jgi:hypothetical protein
MRQRLPRGTPVIVGDSFGTAALRSKSVVVTSKGPVKCNGKGRCAGDWCVGLAVFVASASSTKKDKKMGWRSKTKKVCLTHLKDEQGVLIVPPPLLRQRAAPVPAAPVSRIKGLLPEQEEKPANGNGHRFSVVTWDDLAKAHHDGDITRLALMARKLKTDNEKLKGRVIEAQEKLIEHLTR